MTEEGAKNKWTGWQARVGGRLLNSPLRRLAEALVMGNGSWLLLSDVRASLRGGDVVLDAGCGSGYLSIPITRMLADGQVVCLDSSMDMLALLERKLRKAGLEGRTRTVLTDAADSRLADASIDIVVSMNLVHELGSPADAMAEWARVLKPGGRMLIVDFRDTPLVRRFMQHGHGGEAHGPFSAEELSGLMSDAGLDDVRVEPRRNVLVASGRK